MDVMVDFSIKSCIRFGWETFKKRALFFLASGVVMAVLYGTVSFLTGVLDSALSGSANQPTFVGFIFNWLLSTLVGMGVTAFLLKAHDDPEGVEISNFWHPQSFLKYLGATILISAAVILGAILLIVPGIILALMFMFAAYIVIDRDRGPIEAMKESNRITKGYKWHLLGLGLALAGINILGFLALIVGLLVSIPVTYLATVHAYRVLEQKANAVVAA